MLLHASSKARRAAAHLLPPQYMKENPVKGIGKDQCRAK
jgi:hypothetical protein